MAIVSSGKRIASGFDEDGLVTTKDGEQALNFWRLGAAPYRWIAGR